MGESSVVERPVFNGTLAETSLRYSTRSARSGRRSSAIRWAVTSRFAFARMYCERVERLALVCSRLGPDAPQQAQARLNLADRAELESSSEPVVAAYVPRLLPEKTKRERPDLVAAVRGDRTAERCARPGGDAARHGRAGRRRGHRAGSDDAVLVMCGGADDLMPVDLARSDASQFPSASVAVAENCGTCRCSKSRKAFGERLAAFLAKDREFRLPLDDELINEEAARQDRRHERRDQHDLQQDRRKDQRDEHDRDGRRHAEEGR